MFSQYFLFHSGSSSLAQNPQLIIFTHPSLSSIIFRQDTILPFTAWKSILTKCMRLRRCYRLLLGFGSLTTLAIGWPSVDTRLAARLRRDLLGLHEGPMALDLSEPHHDEAGDDEDPIDVVGDDGAVRAGVIPAQNGVEDTPASSPIELGAAALQFWLEVEVKWHVRGGSEAHVNVPHRLFDVVRTGANS